MTQVASSAHHTRRQIEVGMLLMAAAMLLFPVSDALAKTLTAQLTPAQIAAARFLFQSLLLLPILLLVKGGAFRHPVHGISCLVR